LIIENQLDSEVKEKQGNFNREKGRDDLLNDYLWNQGNHANKTFFLIGRLRPGTPSWAAASGGIGGA